MKIAFVGSRDFSDRDFVESKTREYLRGSDCVEFISGGASGVDSICEGVAHCLGIKCTIIIPDWEHLGKSAGFVRNKDIINQADFVIAFWDGKSKGTKSSIDLALNAGKPIDVYIRK